MDAWTKAETWKEVERLEDCNIVQSKWVFKIKKDAKGMIEHYKACHSIQSLYMIDMKKIS